MRRAWLLYLGRELEKKRNEVQASVGRCKDLLITTVPWLVLRGSPELPDGVYSTGEYQSVTELHRYQC